MKILHCGLASAEIRRAEIKKNIYTITKIANSLDRNALILSNIFSTRALSLFHPKSLVIYLEAQLPVRRKEVKKKELQFLSVLYRIEFFVLNLMM